MADLIDRQELLKAIDTWDKFGYTETGCFVRKPKGDYVPYVYYDDVVAAIKNMPSVTPTERTDHGLKVESTKHIELSLLEKEMYVVFASLQTLIASNAPIDEMKGMAQKICEDILEKGILKSE